MAGEPFGGQTGFGSGLTVTPTPPGFTPQNSIGDFDGRFAQAIKGDSRPRPFQGLGGMQRQLMEQMGAGINGQQITDPQTGRTFTLGQTTFDQAADTGPAYDRAVEAFDQGNQQPSIWEFQPGRQTQGAILSGPEPIYGGQGTPFGRDSTFGGYQLPSQQRNPFMGGGYGMPFGGMPFYGGMMQPSPFYGGLGGLFGGGFGGGPMYGGFGQRFNPYQSMMPQSQGYRSEVSPYQSMMPQQQEYTEIQRGGMSPYQSMMPQQREYTPMMRSAMSPYGIGSLFRRG